MKAIEVKNLSYAYPNGTKALEEVSLEVEEGETVAIVGPNGAGKTTLLLNLTGILKPKKGKIELFGGDITQMSNSDISKNVGIVFQDPDDQLFMPTVFDDVAFGPTNLGYSKEEVKERVKRALTSLSLVGYEEKCPHCLSYGEKKKVSLATVLSMQPKVLLLDEPTANLDPRSRAELIKLIKKLKGEVTIVIATHDVNAIPEIADRVYVLNKKIVAEGIPREIFMDFDLLRKNGLDAPEIMKLFYVLECFGYDCDELPLSIDEAIQELTRVVETRDGHIHLHIHEHTHKNMEKLRKLDHHD